MYHRRQSAAYLTPVPQPLPVRLAGAAAYAAAFVASLATGAAAGALVLVVGLFVGVLWALLIWAWFIVHGARAVAGKIADAAESVFAPRRERSRHG